MTQIQTQTNLAPALETGVQGCESQPEAPQAGEIETAGVEELVERANRENKIIVVKIDKRSSHGDYNYKTYAIAVYMPPIHAKYEEQDILSVEVIEETCGAFQRFTCPELELILKDRGFEIVYR